MKRQGFLEEYLMQKFQQISIPVLAQNKDLTSKKFNQGKPSFKTLKRLAILESCSPLDCKKVKELKTKIWNLTTEELKWLL